MIGDKSKDVIILTPKDPILSLCHIYDWMGSELVQDKDSDVKYTVLLNKKMQLPVHSPEEGEEQEVIKTREIVRKLFVFSTTDGTGVAVFSILRK
jgi:hypothetical protein